MHVFPRIAFFSNRKYVIFVQLLSQPSPTQPTAHVAVFRMNALLAAASPVLPQIQSLPECHLSLPIAYTRHVPTHTYFHEREGTPEDTGPLDPQNIRSKMSLTVHLEFLNSGVVSLERCRAVLRCPQSSLVRG